MDNHHADRLRILPRVTKLFNIVAARFGSLAETPARGRPGDFLAQHPRVIVASLTSKRDFI